MKCWKSAFNEQGSRLIIVALQVGPVKIYAATREALKKKERQGQSHSPQKLRYMCNKFLILRFWVWTESGFRVFQESMFFFLLATRSVYSQRRGDKEV
jgi:hypothetical protein